jgi:hypothetical protein
VTYLDSYTLRELRATRPQPVKAALCAVLWVVACYAWAGAL